MDHEEKKRIINELMNRYDEHMASEHFLEVLAFVSIIVLHNKSQQNPNLMLDKVVHFWVKTVSVLSQSFLVRSPNDELPEA